MSGKLTLADCFKYPNAHIKSKRKHFFLNVLDYLEWNLQSIDVRNLQLVLRSIDDLTEKEKKYIADNFLSISQYWFDSEWDLESLLNACFSDKIKDLIDYLRSINIDIDGFIESGKAVKNEKS